MQNKKVFVLFVEPMLYGLDLIREVYEPSGFDMQYYYCAIGVTGKDSLSLPKNAVVGSGNKKERKKNLHELLDRFAPDFCVINGYTGVDQTIAIRYCIKHQIPYGIDSDTPLHIPHNPLKALVKKLYLKTLFKHDFCYGIPGGTLQKENFTYYGIPKTRIFIRPMSVSRERIKAVYEAIPDKQQLKERYGIEHKHTFLFVGRLEAVKDVRTLISAFAKLRMQREDVALMLVGDGSERLVLQDLVDAQHIEDVHFEGYQVFPNLIDYYKAADVFVLPSEFEPWGLVVNESMTCGLPIIVSSHVGCRQDLVVEGETGLIFEAGNYDALTAAMEKILSCNLTLMGEESMKKMNTWSFDSYLPVFISKVREICSAKY